MICSKCGYVAGDGDKFCVRCGAPLSMPEPPVSDPSPAAEAIEAAAAVPEKAEIAAEEAIEAIEEPVREIVQPAPEPEAIPEPKPVFVAPEPKPTPEKVEPAPEPKPAPVRESVPAAEPIAEAPAENTRLEKPLSTWGYIWRILLFAIPVLNIIPLFVMAFSSGINKNSKNFASGVLVLLLIGLIAGIGALAYLLFTNDATSISEYIQRVVSAITGK